MQQITVMHDSNLIIQPAGHNNIQTWKNFEHTILTPVPIKTIRLYAGDQIANALELIYPSGGVPTWGLKPSNQKKVWSHIKAGNSVLFVGDGKAFMSGRVSSEPLHNKELAVALWGFSEKRGQKITWEYIYFVDDLRYCNISYNDLSNMIGYRTNNNYMSTTIRNYEQSKAVFDLLGLNDHSRFLPKSAHEPYKIPSDPLYVADYDAAGWDSDQQGLLSQDELERIDSEVIAAAAAKDKKNALEHLLSIAATQPPLKKKIYSQRIIRNKTIAGYVKERANYICELCGRLPFRKRDGSFYAEADHIEALFLNGKDHPDNMRCLCSQCHRIITYGSVEEINKISLS